MKTGSHKSMSVRKKKILNKCLFFQSYSCFVCLLRLFCATLHKTELTDLITHNKPDIWEHECTYVIAMLTYMHIDNAHIHSYNYACHTWHTYIRYIHSIIKYRACTSHTLHIGIHITCLHYIDYTYIHYIFTLH